MKHEYQGFVIPAQAKVPFVESVHLLESMVDSASFGERRCGNDKGELFGYLFLLFRISEFGFRVFLYIRI